MYAIEHERGRKYFDNFNEVSSLMPDYLKIKNELVSKRLCSEKLKKKPIVISTNRNIPCIENTFKNYEKAFLKEKITLPSLMLSKSKGSMNLNGKLFKNAVKFSDSVKSQLMNTLDSPPITFSNYW